MLWGYLIEFGQLIEEVISDSLKGYINYKKAQRIEGRYQHNKFCGVVGIADEKTLEAMATISDFQNKKRELKNRLGK